MLNKVSDFIKENKLLLGCDHVIVGLSGGADSVCLFLVLSKLLENSKIGLRAVHVHHGIRGEEADRDLDFCRALCKNKGIELREYFFNVKAYAALHNMTCEEAGRTLRYNAFSSVAAEYDNSRIAVAHHMDDQAETVIFNMCRGSGIRGMRGMLAQNGQIIRPLLCCSRKDIEEYLETEGQTYCTDSTNATDEYSRNIIRHQIIPRLSENVNEQAVKNIASMAGYVASAVDYLDEAVTEEYSRCAVDLEDGILLKKLDETNPFIAKELIRKAVGVIAGGLKDISSTHIENIYQLLKLQSGKAVDVRLECFARKTQDGLLIARKTEAVARAPLTVNPPEEVDYYGHKFVFWLEEWNTDRKISNDIYTKQFDYDKIKNGVCLRNRKEGDFLVVDDIGHRKKLKAYFIDKKISERERNNYILLAEENHILWIVGERISSHYKIDDSTTRVLTVCYKGEYDGRES